MEPTGADMNEAFALLRLLQEHPQAKLVAQGLREEWSDGSYSPELAYTAWYGFVCCIAEPETNDNVLQITTAALMYGLEVALERILPRVQPAQDMTWH